MEKQVQIRGDFEKHVQIRGAQLFAPRQIRGAFENRVRSGGLFSHLWADQGGVFENHVQIRGAFATAGAPPPVGAIWRRGCRLAAPKARVDLNALHHTLSQCSEHGSERDERPLAGPDCRASRLVDSSAIRLSAFGLDRTQTPASHAPCRGRPCRLSPSPNPDPGSHRHRASAS